MNTVLPSAEHAAAYDSPLKGLLAPCQRCALFVALLTGVFYPLVTTGVVQLLFPHQANGSLIQRGATVVGSELIGQAFTAPGYFQPRPSATASHPYNAGASSGSNLGPTNQALIDTVRQRASAYRQENGLATDASVPVDAVTSSASGLDPHISVANAELQTRRVAMARGLDTDQVRRLREQYTDDRVLGLFGEPRVNVLRLNLALDALPTTRW